MIQRSPINNNTTNILLITSLLFSIVFLFTGTFPTTMEEEQGALSSEDEVEEEEPETMTRERFLKRVDSATNGNQLLELLTFLPNTAQRWGHSITMNAVIKILCHSPTFKDECESFYAVKVKKCVETKVPSTFIGLSPSL